MDYLFFFFVFIILYTYPGYYLLLEILNAFVGRKIVKGDYFPSVTMIVTAYNEVKVIKQKMENCLEIEYPDHLFDVLVMSDCSDDGTDKIVEKYRSKSIRFVRLQQRVGKTAAQNESLKHANGEILLFSDANTMYRKNAVKKIVRGFVDPNVGCIGGVLTYESENQIELIKEKDVYLSFDQRLKKLESQISSCIGVDGAIYALRRSVARPLPDSLTTDFLVPLDVISQGSRVVFDDEAIIHEEIAASSGAEFRRKIRTVRVGITVMHAMRRLLNPFRYGWTALFLFSHKILRWAFPFILISFLCLNAILRNENVLYFAAFYLQIVFYLFALVGFFIKRKYPLKIFTLPFYFCMYNVCAIVGFAHFLFQEKTEIWEVER